MNRIVGHVLLATSLVLSVPCGLALAAAGKLEAQGLNLSQKSTIAVPPSTTGATYYVDGKNGSDANPGISAAAAFRTIAKAVSAIAPGDTVLLRAGLYREGINLGGPSGTAAKPITFGAYGDGEVILDGSRKVGSWTNVSGTVWRATAGFVPIGVVVNEVPLKQVRQGQGGSTAPQEGLAGVTSGSGKWYVSGSNVITADFGTTLGTGDPNGADIVVPNNIGDQQHVFWNGVSYVTFKGLTVRGSGSNGFWGYGSHVTIDSCEIKFNGKAAVSFLSGAGIPNSDNAVINSHVYHNVLVNWPRGNNGFAEAGGSWPGTLVWDTNLRPVARGNLVHMNGGEGIISYGTAAALPSGSALFEQNVAYDNWSVNLYFDNQPGDVARNNVLFNHPPDPSNFLYVGTSWPYDSLEKYTVCVMLADEQNSSDSTNSYANLRGAQVYDNILAGCRIGIRDYSEGSSAIAHHGLKDATIANNTIIMAFNTFNNANSFGIYLQDNGANNSNSVVENNIVYGFNNDPVFFSERNGTIPGVTIDYNDYFSASAAPFGAGSNTVTRMSFATWKGAITGADVHSIFADPLFVDVTAFRGSSVPIYDYSKAGIAATSPAARAGIALAAVPVDFSGTARPVPPSIGAFQPGAAGGPSLVTHFYLSILHRTPDAGGQAFWNGEVTRVTALGADLNEVWYAMAMSFYSSSEYAAFGRDDVGFVTDLYNTFFNRSPDAAGLAYWTGEIASGLPREVVLASFMFSPEFQQFTQSIFGNTPARAEVDVTMDFYRGLLGRLPDNGGFSYWLGIFRTAQCQGASAVYKEVEAMSGSFALGAEYLARNRTDAQYVGDLYNAFLRRGGDLAGAQYWINQLDTGAQSREQVRRQFAASPEFGARVSAVISQGCLP